MVFVYFHYAAGEPRGQRWGLGRTIHNTRNTQALEDLVGKAWAACVRSSMVEYMISFPVVRLRSPNEGQSPRSRLVSHTGEGPTVYHGDAGHYTFLIAADLP